MKCSSKLFYGLLMSCLSIRVTGLTKQLSVIQSPSNITVKEGDSAEITCCWNKNTHPVKVRWYKNVRGASTDIQLHQTSMKTNCSTLKIINVTKNDEGDYVCKVIQDIPFLIEGTGNKTTLTVIQIHTTTEDNVSSTSSNSTTETQTSASSPSPSSPPQTLTLPLSLAAAIILLTSCLVFSICKMRNSCKNSERVVIHQTPSSEGEEHELAEEEELSTNSSRGSLQWYQVPVYWSYFDVQRGDEDQ